MTRRCIAVLGGSFDPVHQGHVALARHGMTHLQANELRLIPAGNPWQKAALAARAEDRTAMLQLAFADWMPPPDIDTQEIERQGPTYTIDSAASLRSELGEKVSIVLLMGADQWQRLGTWKDWPRLFDYLHLCIASRPGSKLSVHDSPQDLRRVVEKRFASAEQLRDSPCGLITTTETLSVDITSTDIRKALAAPATENCALLNTWLAPAVLDYIHQHHLYGS
ncbi:MAG: nadD [Paucimonas sp.]|nr:nadD [Paucimonas sp.]